ncbi:hypothetical protein N9C43_05790 [Gammaproteobacteria bacterium]|nr:hypothetical protein [Gammaproteobacteria bacterium]
MTKLKIGICGWGNVATGLYEQLICGNELYSEWELVCIGARRDNPRCNPGNTKIVRDIFAVPDEDIDVLVELIGGGGDCSRTYFKSTQCWQACSYCQQSSYL